MSTKEFFVERDSIIDIINQVHKDINKLDLLFNEIDKNIDWIEYILRYSCFLYNADIIKSLLYKYDISSNTKLKTIEYFLGKIRSDCAFDDRIPLAKVKSDSKNVIEVLLENFDTSTGNSVILVYACDNNNIELAELLLKDIRIDPLAHGCEAFMCACGSGNVELVKLFLSDSRMDPSCYGNSAIGIAYSKLQSALIGQDASDIQSALNVIGLLLSRKEVYNSLSEDKILLYSELFGG